MRRVSAFLLLLCLPIASAQAPIEPPPLLSPQAAYDQASAPVEITRRDLPNWSDIEVNALTAAIAQAKDACRARASEHYTAGDLIAYARLCALGKEWPFVYTAATTYINTPDPRPLLAEAYAFEVQADLNLGEEKQALGASIAMLHAVPYGPISDDVTTATVRYLQFAYTGDATTLLAERQPFLLELMQSSQLTPDPAYPIAGTSIPLHTVFEHALTFAALELYDNQPFMAKAILADLDRYMPAKLPPDEAIYIADARRQFALLGTHFPDLPGAVSLLPATGTPPAQPKFGSVTVFLLFPPWCAQCIRLAQETVPALVRTGIFSRPDSDIHIYALLADTLPPLPAKPAPHPTNSATHHPPAAKPATDPAKTSDSDTPPTAEDKLRKTPTLVVAPSTLYDFAATDFPFLIATDHNGIIRLMVSGAPDNALNQNGPIDQITDFISEHWPMPASEHRPSPPPSPMSPK